MCFGQWVDPLPIAIPMDTKRKPGFSQFFLISGMTYILLECYGCLVSSGFDFIQIGFIDFELWEKNIENSKNEPICKLLRHEYFPKGFVINIRA